MPPKSRQGNPEAGYYPLPTPDVPPPSQPHPGPPPQPEPFAAIRVGHRKLTAEDSAFLATLDPAEHDLPDEHVALVEDAEAFCVTCGEPYPGTGSEHWIGWDEDSEQWALCDATHRGHWIGAPGADDEKP